MKQENKFLTDSMYLDLMDKILSKGVKKSDRTGTGTTSIFGEIVKYDLSEEFPLLTSKKVYVKGVIVELLWFLRGETNIKYLIDNNVKIWNHNAYDFYMKKFPNSKKSIVGFLECVKEQKNIGSYVYGDLGDVYGKQWRDFNSEGVDQIKGLVESLKNNPNSRRHYVSAWNPIQVHEMALPPCHLGFQVYIREDVMDLRFDMRSNDYFLGNPFNIASYGALLHILAKTLGYKVGILTGTFGDIHIYSNHMEAVEEQKDNYYNKMVVGGSNNDSKPQMIINKDLSSFNDIMNLKFSDFTITNYNPLPSIKAKMAV